MTDGPVQRRKRLGELLNYYYRVVRSVPTIRSQPKFCLYWLATKKTLPFFVGCQILSRNWFPMHENCGDAVVRIDGFQRILRHEHKIGNLARLDCPNLRFQFELARVVDRSRTKNLFQRHSRPLQAFHLQKTV